LFTLERRIFFIKIQRSQSPDFPACGAFWKSENKKSALKKAGCPKIRSGIHYFFAHRLCTTRPPCCPRKKICLPRKDTVSPKASTLQPKHCFHRAKMSPLRRKNVRAQKKRLPLTENSVREGRTVFRQQRDFTV